jgi:glycosyltransferase involved in cell wall biosynthesis
MSPSATTPEAGNFCVIIPSYNEQGRIGRTVEGARKYCRRVVVVDDGSRDSTAEEAEKAGALVIRHEMNKGKGVALQTGFDHAMEKKFDFVITMDADGQHDPDDIPTFLEACRTTDFPVLTGNRMDRAGSMPWMRRMTNRFMSWLLSRKIGQRVADTQSGFRLYRSEVLPWLRAESARFAAESEVLLNLAARNVRIGAVPIKVIYRDEKSKINPIRDTFRFFAMLRRFDMKRRKDE